MSPTPDEATVASPSAALGTGDDSTLARPGVAVATAPDGTPIVPGFDIEREIARGGMGAVYAARDRALGREVAVKVMLPGMRVAEFEREPRIAARLPHPGVPPVHALGTLADGRPFLAMKLIKGDTLDALLRAAPDRARFVSAFEQVCQAVGYAHSVGIVHRDLKPSNVMVGAFGEVQVMDWGLAREMDAEPEPASGTDGHRAPTVPGASASDDTLKTVAGQIKGTPAYMAPEQARGEPVDARADVFALGGILAVILTGKPPFAGNSVLDTIIRAASAALDQVHARLDSCGADQELIALAKRCRAARADDRPANGAAVAEAVAAYHSGVDERLRRAEQDRAVTAAEAREQRKRRRVQLALACVVAAVAAVGGIAANAIQRQRAEERVEAEKRLAGEQLEAEKRRAADAAAAEESRRETEAEARAQAISTAETAVVPQLLDALGPARARVVARLKPFADRPIGEPAGLHARLALLDDEPERAKELGAYLPAYRPAELLPVARRLVPHANAVAPPLWAVLAARAAEPGKRARRRRARGARADRRPLAEGRARGGRKRGAREPIGFRGVGRGARTGARRARARASRGVCRASREHRRRETGRFRTRGRSEQERPHGRTARAVRRRPPGRADRVCDGRRTAAPATRSARAAREPRSRCTATRRAVERIRGQVVRSSAEARMARTGRGHRTRSRSRAGLLHERFAFVQTLPLADLARLCDALAPSGYRPTRVRPYRANGSALAAAVWVRDGGPWKLAVDVTVAVARARESVLRVAGFHPVDAAGFADAGASAARVALGGGLVAAGPPDVRFVVLWAELPKGREPNRMNLGTARMLLSRELDDMKAASLAPIALQSVLLPGESLARHCSVWGPNAFGWSMAWGRARDTFVALNPTFPIEDVTVTRATDRDPQFAGVWFPAKPVETQTVILPPDQARAKARELTTTGWRPAALGCDGETTAAVWQRSTATDASAQEAGRRCGYAAAALLALGHEPAWAAFRFPADGDPTARSYLLQRLPAVFADAGPILRRLDVEDDLSAQRALILALGELPLPAVPPAEVDALRGKLMFLYRTHPDAGMHGALDWLLRRRWKWPDVWAFDAECAARARAAQVVRALPDAVPLGPLGPLGAMRRALPPRGPTDSDWFVNGEGQTFAVVRGPVEFTMGTPTNEPQRYGSEVQHRKRIPRTFAIATREVTVAEYNRSLSAPQPFNPYAPVPDAPVLMAWYDAAEYCNWLSAREGIPPDQWCYEPNAQGRYAEGMKIKQGHLKLTGYRLPTEAEWEFACRAGSRTSRPYGRGDELLSRYAWFIKTAGDRTHPTGLLRPNERGLFDILGNAGEWNENPNLSYATNQLDDIEDAAHLVLQDRLTRAIRSGTFFNYTNILRSGNRNFNGPGSRTVSDGFRVARTLPD
jgi:formylglycine-generating enzyme required for sulfatase activity